MGVLGAIFTEEKIESHTGDELGSTSCGKWQRRDSCDTKRSVRCPQPLPLGKEDAQAVGCPPPEGAAPLHGGENGALEGGDTQAL